MGRRRRKGRDINGILLLNKPEGLSSNQALQQVKHLYFAAKAGHTGALDPLATGMLPICFGEATKFSQFLLNSDKGYRVIAKLGIRTDSSDSTGEVVETRPVAVKEAQLVKALKTFEGKISQVPSMFSALKHEGKPLYYYARQGIEIDREARQITIYDIELLRFDQINNEVELYIECSKGTYIRTIIDDLGQMLGCGAHVTMLNRTFVADFPPEQMIDITQLEKDREEGISLDQYLLPMDSALEFLPEVVLDQDSEHYFLQGQAINYPDLSDVDILRVYNDSGDFLGIAEVNEDLMLAPKRLVVR
ncbi:MAG: tRNA pseudouridine(55) synthase TruB [Gammaproteobacteria bacterium]|nr:tRNA pseudouridine(55) synthase TruB [Gammaproteobacteria bacterium]